MHDEALYYNAVAIALRGNSRILRKYALMGSWKAAYEDLLMGTMPVPEAETAWKPLEKEGIKILFKDGGYPPLLSEINPAPVALYIRGRLPATTRSVAIVGTRRATPEGKNLAEQFGRELASAGLTVVSGLALGIDAMAHAGALEAGGACVAVLAHGLDRIYPETNRRLAEKIISSGGAIVSEYPPHEPPFAYRFIERNRIISGISKGTLVIEAPEASGSLATANFALEQNRDVFVVPGPITHPNFRGANALIRQGAELVTGAANILAAYGIENDRLAARIPQTHSPEEKLIVTVLAGASEPLDVDKIIAMTKLEPRIVNQTLTFLLLRKTVREIQGQYTI